MDMLNEPDGRLGTWRDDEGQDGRMQGGEEQRMANDARSARSGTRSEQSREAAEYWRKLSERVSSIREKIVRRVEKVLSESPIEKERRDDDRSRTGLNPSNAIGRNGVTGSSI